MREGTTGSESTQSKWNAPYLQHYSAVNGSTFSANFMQTHPYPRKICLKKDSCATDIWPKELSHMG